MKLWEIGTGGATYWAVAPDLKTAAAVAFKCWEDEGSLEDVEEITIDGVPDERAKKLKFRAEPYDDNPECSMAEEAARHSEPTVIACTEWP